MADFIHRRSHPIICQLEARVIEGGIFSCTGEGGDACAARTPKLRTLTEATALIWAKTGALEF